MIHRADLATAVAALHREVAYQRVLHRRRIECRAIMEGAAGPQAEDQVLLIRPFAARGEHEHDVQLFVEFEQLAAQRGHDGRADIGAGQHAIEDVRIVAHADPQCCASVAQSPAMSGSSARRMRRARPGEREGRTV
jgi:hypothetical protein